MVLIRKRTSLYLNAYAGSCQKRYRPEHIELEKEWHLGHDAKGGRADICVTDTSGNMLFIIECKTWGREYDKALNNTKKRRSAVVLLLAARAVLQMAGFVCL